MTKQMPKRRNSVWAELSSDNQDDWNEVLKLLTDSFSDSTPFLKTDLPEEERKKFLHEYFKYIYETEMSNERSGLICVKKKNEDDSIAVVYASCFLHRIESSAGDRSGMDAFDSKFADRLIRGDAWINEEILDKMTQASQDLGIHAIFGAYIACRVDLKGSGLGRQFASKAIDYFYKDGLRRGYFAKEKTCIFYCTVDDPSALGFQKQQQNVQIAHLHLMGKPICCFADPSLKSNSNCIFVFAKVVSGNLDLKNTLAPYFENS